MTDLLKTGILHEGNRNQERSDLISVRKVVKKDNGRRRLTTTRWSCRREGDAQGMEIVASLGAISLPERANAGVSQPDVTDQRDPWRLHNDAASIIVMPPHGS